MTVDVAIIGGGVIGLSSAWRCAQRGLSVELIDAGDIDGKASLVAGGLLAPITESRIGEEDLLQLSLASWHRWPDFAAELEAVSEREVGFRDDGTVMVALDADDRSLLKELVDRHRSLGLDVQDLSASELRALEPSLAPGIRRGAFVPRERSVDPVEVVAALRIACERAGVTFRTEQVRSLENVDAGAVVVAAGAWSRQLDGVPSPVRPVKGQILTVRQRPGDKLIQHNVRGQVRGSEVYLIPRNDGRVLCGATVEERGWDMPATAGAAYELLRDMLALVPALDDAELVGLRTGFRPGSPDDMPMIGRSAGFVVATGHFRNGILLTPITSEAVVALVTGGELPKEVVPCDPARFAEDGS